MEPMNLRGRVLDGMRVIVLLTALISYKGLAVAEAQSLTPGTVDLSSTFEAISVRAHFSGDSNSNATATIQFRKSGEVGWHDAYPPMIDRRVSIGGVTNPYAFEARGSIVGLTSNTAYDVQVTWADPDGISGAQPGVATVTTLSYTPPTGGSTITVIDNASLASALSSVNPGQTVHLNAGIYSPFTISRSGTAAARIVIEGAPGGASIVSGLGTTQNITVNASFVVVQNLTLSASDFSGIVLASNAHDVFVQNNALQDIARLCAAGPTTTHYGDTGVLINTGASRIYVLGNTITSTSLAACVQTIPFDGPGTGVAWFGCTTCVIKGNLVTGQFRDAISADDDTAGIDVDVYNNTVSGYVDDGIESKGQNVNTRLWGNVIIADRADTCIAANTDNHPTVAYGPIYIFRNTCRVTSANNKGQTTYKINGPAPMYLFHNSIDSSLAPLPWDGYVMNAIVNPLVALNNILKSSGSLIGGGSTALAAFDDNLGIVTSGASWAYNWNGSTTYDTIAAFRTGTGNEAHGLNADPLFTDTALHIGANSPAVDRGVIIPNFNTVDSAWPYSGSAPDIGAFELQTSAAQAPSAPTTFGLR
jgi:hypothetical protein